MKLEALLPSVAKMDVKHPVTKDSMGFSISVVGHDSKQFRDTYRVILKNVQNKGDKAQADLLELEQNNIKLIASCVVGWDSEAEEAFGPYTPQRAHEIMMMDELAFLRDQVEKFIGERANFFRRGVEATS